MALISLGFEMIYFSFGVFFVGVNFVVWNFNLTLVVGSILKLLSFPETNILHLLSKPEDLVSLEVLLECYLILVVAFLSDTLPLLPNTVIRIS